MALTQRLEFRQSQSLVMTPQLMQAIKLLQLSNLDLSAFVEEELERNPLLERASDGPEAPVAGEAMEPSPFSDSGEAGQGEDGSVVSPASTAGFGARPAGMDEPPPRQPRRNRADPGSPSRQRLPRGAGGSRRA